MHFTKSLTALVFSLAATSTVAVPPGYHCNPAKCVAPKCRCPSVTPPIPNPPQFVLITYDDSVQSCNTMKIIMFL